jgi:hypothetical protein
VPDEQMQVLQSTSTESPSSIVWPAISQSSLSHSSSVQSSFPSEQVQVLQLTAISSPSS